MNGEALFLVLKVKNVTFIAPSWYNGFKIDSDINIRSLFNIDIHFVKS